MQTAISTVLSGTLPVWVNYERDGSAPYEFTYEEIQKNYNNFVTRDTKTPGVLVLQNIFNGVGNAPWHYKEITLNGAYNTTLGTFTINDTDAQALEAGSYYQNLSSGETFFISDIKSTDPTKGPVTHTLIAVRGLFGTKKVPFAASSKLLQLNTIVLDSESDSAAAGVWTVAIDTAFVAGDSVTFMVDGQPTTFVCVESGASGNNQFDAGEATAQATAIAALLTTAYSGITSAGSTSNITMTQKTASTSENILDSVVATGTGQVSVTNTTTPTVDGYEAGLGMMYLITLPQPGIGQNMMVTQQ